MKKLVYLLLLLMWLPGITSAALSTAPDGGAHGSAGVSLYPCENNLIEVMFAWDSKVRLRNGTLTDFGTPALEGVEPLLQQLPGYAWQRLTDLPEAVADRLEEQGERNTGRDQYNLNNIYRLVVPEGTDLWTLSAELEALPGVLRAMPVPKPVSPPALPGNYQPQQGYLNAAANNPSGINATWAWTQAGGTGTGITVCDLEYSWNYNHADVTKAVGSQINPNTITDPFNNTNHGTAVIGMLVADNNSWGTTGICYGSNLKTCGTYWSGSWNPAGAIIYATAALAAGDIILIEQQWDYAVYPNSGMYIPIEWYGNTTPSAQTYNAVYSAIVSAVAAGINVVEAGGNGNINTGALTWYGNSGAIIVGAGGALTTNNLQRLSFSSYGPRFDLQGWGETVVTTGYGDLYSAQGVNYYYTGTFNGTSSSSPVVAGALACLEGYWLANVSTVLPAPSFLRTQLATYGTAQVTPPTGNIGPRPDLYNAILNLPAIASDWGDAPDGPYPTLAVNNGANHTNTGLKLGLLIDTELNGQPNATATGDDLNPLTADDEDGVAFTSTLTPGTTASVQVIASAPGFLNAWIDFNLLNAWADPGEQIFTSVLLAAGVNNLTFNVPAGATPGQTFARFRFSMVQQLGYMGAAPNGEVEDYQVQIEMPLNLDWGDAPDLPYPTLMASNGARHNITGVMLGNWIDPEPNGQPNLAANGDDMNPPGGLNDEDGVLFLTPLRAGQVATVQVTVNALGFLNAWIDYSKVNAWAEPNEWVVNNMLLMPGITNINIAVPAGALPGNSYARFRFSSQGGLTWFGLAQDGEVEDYQVMIHPPEQFDWGDAPDPTYPTLAASNGANHTIDWVTFLGAQVDAESDGQPDPAAMGDDNNILNPPPNDDEDGVIFLYPWRSGQVAGMMVTASVTGFLNVWIDFNGNGTWIDPGEKVFTDNILLPGVNMLNFPIPAGVQSGMHFARFRFCTQQGVGITGNAPNGEVEDYAVLIEPPPPTFDWGDAPDPTYPTLNANSGASHQIDGITFLGANVDAESDGQPHPNAQGDDLAGIDDEDGVVFMWPLAKGNPCKIKVTASVGDALFSGWIDYNGDGDWSDAGEQIYADLNLLTGNNYLTFIVPRSAVAGTTFARFRFSHQPGLSYTGAASDGEVEDYEVSLVTYGDLKWSQPPEPLFPGIHATDGSILADDWKCNGEVVTDLHWWGNYELDQTGTEKRGAGINHFLVQIHSGTLCLPGPVLKTWVVPFAPALEIPTGLLNNEGSPIYKYDLLLPEPFIQVEDSMYWLSVTAISNVPANPPSWRWQEANRWLFPILCGSATLNATGAWQTITWPFGSLVKYSDLAFEISSWVVDTLRLQNITVSNGQNLCYDATSVIVVAGSGTTFTVNSGGSATFIAGLKILFEPGTVAYSGSYLHGSITATGTYCPRAPVMTGYEVADEEVAGLAAGNRQIVAYPNPTGDDVNLQLPGLAGDLPFEITVYQGYGKLISRAAALPGSKVVIGLGQWPSGLYLIRVSDGRSSHAVKVIRE